VQLLGPSLQKLRIVVHGGHEDIRILQNELHIEPQLIFDTQIAAALMGKHYPIALKTLLQELLQRPAGPQATLSNWSHRPLNQKQLLYAAEDAKLLLHLQQKFSQQLDPQSLEWAWQASSEMALQARQSTASGLEWMTWGAAEILDPVAQRILTRLLIWRDGVAREKNRPPNYILPRGIALDLARRRPHRRRELLANRRINMGLVNRHGEQLLECIRNGENESRVFPLPSPQERLVASLICSWAVAQPLAIHPSLLMPKELAIDLAMHGITACEGWRKNAIGDNLTLFLTGQSGLYLEKNKPTVRNS